ncbi:MAG: PD-(D/E)XK nuclease family protein [Chloroflexota bacterium]|nr:PD-(D/E)XK nuclease family protein [Chloroflexota bacterium]
MPKRKYKASFTQRLLALISEPGFIKFENILSEPNFFKIVGRTHYERWHSSFFGWLLDVNGSHLLADYVLRRFLLLLLNEKCLRAKNHSEKFLVNILPVVEFSEIQVSPNENMSSEISVSGVGRFDIFLTASYSDEEGNTGNLNVLFELKIDSKPDGNQSAKYADWIYANHPNDVNLLIYLTPKLLLDSKSTVGDERWYCVNYQILNDNLLIPLLDHPNLNEKVKPFIIQYIKNLKNRYKGIKMAITNEEKRLALALYEKYSDVFDSIYDALVSLGAIDYSTTDVVENKGRATGRLAVRINQRVLSNETVRLLFKDILVYIVDNEYVLKVPLPWGASKSRYVVTNEEPPIHPNGRDFFYPESYKGYTIETHYARDRAIKVLSDLCEKLELEFEQIDT